MSSIFSSFYDFLLIDISLLLRYNNIIVIKYIKFYTELKKNTENTIYKGKGFMIAALITGFFGAVINIILLVLVIISLVLNY
jgi:hypothetical protein